MASGECGADQDPSIGPTQSRNGFGCSGDKPHRYVFTLWALKVDELDLNGEASGAMVGFNLRANALGTATLTAVFGR